MSKSPTFIQGYDTVLDKGLRLGARRHKMIYNYFSIGDPPKNYGTRVYNKFSWFIIFRMSHIKLDGVGPVDNRPSPDKFHHFVKKQKKHGTRDTWHVTPDTWHITHDMWHMVGGTPVREWEVKIRAKTIEKSRFFPIRVYIRVEVSKFFPIRVEFRVEVSQFPEFE